MKRPRNLKKKLLLVSFGLLFGLFMSEIFLRLIGYSYPLFYTTDYYRGIALRPGAEGWYQREDQNYVRINSEGLRDREHPRTKPPDTVRIALLGDSYAEAMQVPMEQTFWWLLQQDLERCNVFPGKHVEIINFGVSGYGTGQELITLQQQVWNYSPDMVMLTVTTNNDITDNLLALKNTDEIPYFVYRNDELVSDASFRNSSTFRWRASRINRIGTWFREHLRTIQLIHYAHLIARLRLAEWRSQNRTAAPPQNQSGAAAPDITIDNKIYLEPHDENWNEAWHITEGLIKEMRDEVNRKGAKFLVVTTSNPIQVYPDPATRQRFLQYLGAADIFYPNLRLKALADREHFDFLDLARRMLAYADQNKVFLHGFGNGIGNGHWNATGHHVAADLIAQRLCNRQ